MGALLLTACVNTSQVVTGKTLPPTNPATIKVYSTPPSSFKEIARIDAKKNDFAINSMLISEEKFIEQMREVAASLGANGILIRKVNRGSRTIGTSYGTTGHTSNKAGSPATDGESLHGVAILVLETEEL